MCLASSRRIFSPLDGFQDGRLNSYKFYIEVNFILNDICLLHMSLMGHHLLDGRGGKPFRSITLSQTASDSLSKAVTNVGGFLHGNNACHAFVSSHLSYGHPTYITNPFYSKPFS